MVDKSQPLSSTVLRIHFTDPVDDRFLDPVPYSFVGDLACIGVIRVDDRILDLVTTEQAIDAPYELVIDVRDEQEAA